MTDSTRSRTTTGADLPIEHRRALPPPAGLSHAASPPSSPSPRSAPPSRSQRRRHPAAGARIAAAGIGVSTMLGLIATMGVAAAGSGEAGTSPSDAAVPTALPQPVPPVQPPADAPGEADNLTDPTVSAPAPVVLTARPEVRVITRPAPAASPAAAAAPAPAPAATTRGSR